MGFSCRLVFPAPVLLSSTRSQVQVDAGRRPVVIGRMERRAESGFNGLMLTGGLAQGRP